MKPTKTTGVGSRTTRDADLNGGPPALATTQDLAGANPPHTGRWAHRRTARDVPDKPPRINLKAVAEALIDEGLDPATEIARVLRGRPVLDEDGNPTRDPITGEPLVSHLVDADIRLRTLNSLLEFFQPKLKAVEMKVNGNLDISSDQLETRLAALLEKASA